MSKITVYCICPPIPDRNFDYACYDADTYDADCDQDGYFSTCVVGYGKTAEAALVDYNEQIQECA